MASFLDRVKVTTAVDKRTQLAVDSDHITTANFMQFNVAYSQELVPNQSVDINMSTFARLQPLPVPTYGRAKIQNRAFFVPFRTVYPAFNDFITDARHSTSDGTSMIYNSVPTFSHESLVSLFSGAGGNLYGQRVTDDTAPFDFVIKENQVPPIYKVKLTKKGRWALKLFQSLGYQFIPEFDNQSDEQSLRYSALPLLAVAKVYADWYYPSMYASSPDFAELEAIFNRDNGNLDISLQDIFLILGFLSNVNYDSDYFTSAWLNPQSPNLGTFSDVTIPDITARVELGTTISEEVSNEDTTQGTATIQNTSATGIKNISQYAIDALKSLTDYLKRHQLVGGRALDRYLSRFGVKLSDEILKRSTYIGTSEQYIQFGDVMSQTDTYDTETDTGASLGAYAGKGIGYNEGNFTYNNEKEYGMVIIISTIVPKIGYYQGIDRTVMHTTRLDFWTPEFDNLGVQAVSRAELYVPDTNDSLVQRLEPVNYWNSVFGFVPRYAEYKIGKDRLTGDFRVNSINVGMDSWHTFRVLNPSALNLTNNEEFVSGNDASQYSRIFNNFDDEYDKFIVIHNFNVKSNAPFMSYWDTYEFESKGQDVVTQANGVKMN